jgi:hypothetical protein
MILHPTLKNFPGQNGSRKLTHDHALETGHVALLGGNLKVSVDNSDGQENTSSAAEGAEEIATNGQSTNASTTESGGSGDDALELLVHGLLTVTSHNETLFLELLGNVAGRRAGDLDPGLGEDSAGNEHVDDEDGGLERVGERLGDAERRRPEYISNASSIAIE